MPHVPDTNPIRNVCPNCGSKLETGQNLCLQCGFVLQADIALTPTGVSPRSQSLEASASQDAFFGKDSLAVFQFLPSGSCSAFPLKKPLVMGRDAQGNADNFLDLSEYQAEHHGVSRQHVRFWRMNDNLLVMDMGSTNGTYLRGQKMTPQKAYVVRHGNRLIIGSLHVIVTFADRSQNIEDPNRDEIP